MPISITVVPKTPRREKSLGNQGFFVYLSKGMRVKSPSAAAEGLLYEGVDSCVSSTIYYIVYRIDVYKI